MPSRRLQLLLFALSFVTYAWFHQGGGWNQNARFAEVRAMVEEGGFAINDYLVYFPQPGMRVLTRPRVVRDEFTHEGKKYQLSWGDWRNVGTAQKPDWCQLTVDDRPIAPDAEMVIMGEGTCTGDAGYAPDGHFHPNKPPGSSLLAAIPYFAIYHLERWTGANPDDWWVMSVNAWLCSLLTVGLASALCVVLVLRLAAQLFPGNLGAAVGAALAFGFGTTFFPFATLMFDHNITAVLLLASFSAVRSDRPLVGGVWSGCAAVTNYLAAIPGAIFGFWALCRSRDRRAEIGKGKAENQNQEFDRPASSRRRLQWNSALRFTLGVLPCLVVLLAYNVAAFGSPFMLNTSLQNPAFKEIAPAFLGMFSWPSWFAVLTLTISPWRGIFVLSPVIIVAMVCLPRRGIMKAFSAKRRVILTCTAFSWFTAIVIGVSLRRPISEWGALSRASFVFLALFPVVVAAIVCLFRHREEEALLAERRLIVACAAFFFLINITFNGFHGGFAAGPRYLIPALPFICLPVAAAFVRWPKTTTVLATVSILQQTLLTVTDALNPLGVGAHAWVNRPGEWQDKLFGNSLVWRYAWPFFAQGRPWRVIDDKFAEWLGKQRDVLKKKGLSEAEADVQLEKLRLETWEKVVRGEEEPLWIAAIPGPVSVNALGLWDGTFFQKFRAHSEPAKWAAFNVGEFFWPESRWSIAPLFMLWIAGAIALRRWMRSNGTLIAT